MYDIYFTNLLSELNGRMHLFEKSQLEQASATHDRNRIHTVRLIWQEEEIVKEVENSTRSNQPIKVDNLATIIDNILEKPEHYHEKARVTVKNPSIDYDKLAEMASHYENMSLKVYSKGTLFDARDANSWKAIGLNIGDSVQLYAQDLENGSSNQERSYNAIHENLARLIGEENPQDANLDHYIVRELIVKNEHGQGIHLRPMSGIVTGANLYQRNVSIANPLNNTTVNAKSAMGILSKADKLSQPDLELSADGKKIKLHILYEPGYDTSQSFDTIKALINGDACQ